MENTLKAGESFPVKDTLTGMTVNRCVKCASDGTDKCPCADFKVAERNLTIAKVKEPQLKKVPEKIGKKGKTELDIKLVQHEYEETRKKEEALIATKGGRCPRKCKGRVINKGHCTIETCIKLASRKAATNALSKAFNAVLIPADRMKRVRKFDRRDKRLLDEITTFRQTDSGFHYRNFGRKVIREQIEHCLCPKCLKEMKRIKRGWKCRKCNVFIPEENKLSMPRLSRATKELCEINEVRRKMGLPSVSFLTKTKSDAAARPAGKPRLWQLDANTVLDIEKKREAKHYQPRPAKPKVILYSKDGKSCPYCGAKNKDVAINKNTDEVHCGKCGRNSFPKDSKFLRRIGASESKRFLKKEAVVTPLHTHVQTVAKVEKKLLHTRKSIILPPKKVVVASKKRLGLKGKRFKKLKKLYESPKLPEVTRKELVETFRRSIKPKLLKRLFMKRLKEEVKNRAPFVVDGPELERIKEVLLKDFVPLKKTPDWFAKAGYDIPSVRKAIRQIRSENNESKIDSKRRKKSHRKGKSK